MKWWAGSRPGRAATSPRGVGSARRPCRRAGGGRGGAVRAPPAGALGLQDGRGCVGESRSVGGCGRPSRLPSTRASRADHRPTRQRPTVRQGCLDVAGSGDGPLPRQAGRRQTGWLWGAGSGLGSVLGVCSCLGCILLRNSHTRYNSFEPAQSLSPNFRILLKYVVRSRF